VLKEQIVANLHHVKAAIGNEARDSAVVGFAGKADEADQSGLFEID
jgi:hypothetical protein